jgi:hypothetical protein
MANKRITDVDFLDSLSSNESFFVNQNNAIKQINKSNIVFDIVNGGTGASDAETALENLGAAPANHSHDASDITGTLPTNSLPIISVSKGGTGASDAATARNNLGITPANIGAKVSSDVEDIEHGGTGSSNGADGLKNLFALYVTCPKHEYVMPWLPIKIIK